MRSSVHRGRTHIMLGPGEYHACHKKPIFSTILGSCVATCLWDPVHHVMGMNHFLLANTQSQRRDPLLFSQAGRYGIHAMELLINAMLKKGAERKHLQQKRLAAVTCSIAKEKRFCRLPLASSIANLSLSFLNRRKSHWLRPVSAERMQESFISLQTITSASMSNVLVNKINMRSPSKKETSYYSNHNKNHAQSSSGNK